MGTITFDPTTTEIKVNEDHLASYTVDVTATDKWGNNTIASFTVSAGCQAISPLPGPCVDMVLTA